MFSPFSRPIRLVLFAGLIVFSGSAAEAGNFSVNLNLRTSTQTLPQTVLLDTRQSHVLGGVTTPPPPVYQGGPRRPSKFDPNTQFDGMSCDNSLGGKPPK